MSMLVTVSIPRRWKARGGIASFIVAMFNHYRYRLALFPNNQSIRRRSNCQRDAASLYVVAVEGSSVYVNEKVTELFSL
jgi:hypothetical protein